MDLLGKLFSYFLEAGVVWKESRTTGLFLVATANNIRGEIDTVNSLPESWNLERRRKQKNCYRLNRATTSFFLSDRLNWTESKEVFRFSPIYRCPFGFRVLNGIKKAQFFFKFIVCVWIYPKSPLVWIFLSEKLLNVSSFACLVLNIWIPMTVKGFSS